MDELPAVEAIHWVFNLSFIGTILRTLESIWLSEVASGSYQLKTLMRLLPQLRLYSMFQNYTICFLRVKCLIHYNNACNYFNMEYKA